MDRSDDVAAEQLVRPEGGLAGSELHFRVRLRLHVVLGFGSWALVILAPMTIMLASGELPSACQALAVVPLSAIGLALAYTAWRASVGRARLWVEGRTLRFARTPWPTWARAWPLGRITRVRVEIHPSSLRYPAQHRGMAVARPFQVHLSTDDGSGRALPLALGATDAADVARWIEDARL